MPEGIPQDMREGELASRLQGEAAGLPSRQVYGEPSVTKMVCIIGSQTLTLRDCNAMLNILLRSVYTIKGGDAMASEGFYEAIFRSPASAGPEKLREVIIQTLGLAEAPKQPKGRPGPAGKWTKEELAQLWRTLNDNARQVIREISKRPNGYEFDAIREKLGLDAVHMGGQLSSVGHRLQQFPPRPRPVIADTDAKVYRLDPDFAAFLRQEEGGEE